MWIFSKMGESFAQFRMGVSQINVHQHRFSPTVHNMACPFCAEEKKSVYSLNVQSSVT